MAHPETRTLRRWLKIIAQLEHITASPKTDKGSRRNPADFPHHEILRKAHDGYRSTDANGMDRRGFEKH
jgi:hypothetical protein